MNIFPIPPSLERQVTMGGAKQVITAAIAQDSGKWCVVQQCGSVEITKFLKKAWKGENVSAEEFDLNTMFWFHIVNPQGEILNLHVNLQGLVSQLASLGIHSENDIYLINNGDPTEMDKDFESRISRLFYKYPVDK